LSSSLEFKTFTQMAPRVGLFSFVLIGAGWAVVARTLESFFSMGKLIEMFPACPAAQPASLTPAAVPISRLRWLKTFSSKFLGEFLSPNPLGMLPI